MNETVLRPPWQRSPLLLWLRDRLTVLDPALLAIVGALTLVGLVTLYSAANDFPWRFSDQLRNLAIAAAVMFIAANIPPSLLQKAALPAYLVGVALLVGVAVAGVTVKGATRWLDIGVTRIQPSEMMRLALPMMLAWYFHKREGSTKPLDFLVAAMLVVVPVGLIMKQPDLGTSLLVVAAGAYVIFFAGLPWRWIAAVGAAGLAALPMAWTMMHDYQRERVLTLIDPTTDPLGKGFHTLQATIAIGSGGAFGKGWMQGTQNQLDFIPERTTDFIFAVFGEEFGYLGAILLVGLYLAIVARGLIIAARASTLFGRLMAATLSMNLFTYVFVNMGMVSGILPVVGVPLPLMSYGGTAMITLLLGMGILMSVASHRQLNKS